MALESFFLIDVTQNQKSLQKFWSVLATVQLSESDSQRPQESND